MELGGVTVGYEMALLRQRQRVVAATQCYRAGIRFGDAGDQAQQRGLAHAVASAQQGEAAGGGAKREAFEDLATAAAAGKIGDDEFHPGMAVQDRTVGE